LDLLLKNGNYAEAADHLLHLKPGTEFAFSHSSDIPLIDSSSWTKFIDDPSIFEKTAANVWIANKNLSSAIEILEDGLSRDSNDEQLAYMLLEIAKLTNRTDILDDVLRFSEVREIHSTELICSMAESALIRRQEVLAARYLSTIFDSTENQPRIKALQSILLKHNGNFTEANLIYNDLKKELD
jgi:hypothetical protein